jgi:hypothetical protein
MRIRTLADAAPLLSKLSEEKRRAFVQAWRDADARAAARINAALDADDAAHGKRESGAEPRARRGSKYGNEFVEHEGALFHSKGEFMRWRELQVEQRAGLISDLRRQVEFPIAAGGAVVCSWFADFVYMRDGREVVEDFKGYRTDIYKLKKKFVEAIYKIKILETGSKQKTKEKRAKWKTYTASRRRTKKG